MPEKRKQEISKKLEIKSSVDYAAEEKLPAVFKSSVTEVIAEIKEEEDLDFQKARESIAEALTSSSEAITDLLEIAKSSEMPRAYEVLGNLIKAQADVSLSLLKIHEMRKGLKTTPDASVTNNSSVTNNLVVGSAKDLLKIVKQASEDAKKAVTIIEAEVEKEEE